MLALPSTCCRNIWILRYHHVSWEEPARLGQPYKIHQFCLNKASRNFSNRLTYYCPNKHSFSVQQPVFLFSTGQEPTPQTCSWAGAVAQPPAGAELAHTHLNGINTHMLGHMKLFLQLFIVTSVDELTNFTRYISWKTCAWAKTLINNLEVSFTS